MLMMANFHDKGEKGSRVMVNESNLGYSSDLS